MEQKAVATAQAAARRQLLRVSITPSLDDAHASHYPPCCIHVILFLQVTAALANGCDARGDDRARTLVSSFDACWSRAVGQYLRDVPAAVWIYVNDQAVPKEPGHFAVVAGSSVGRGVPAGRW